MQFVVFGAWRVKWLEACRRLAAVINKARVCFAHIWLSRAATADVSPEASLRGLRATNKEQVLIVAYLGCASSPLSDACLSCLPDTVTHSLIQSSFIQPLSSTFGVDYVCTSTHRDSATEK
jgi:hypothetical protein